MTDDFEQQGWVRLGVAGALAREYASDGQAFLGLLARTLEGSFPNLVDVKRTGLLTKRIVSVTVHLSDLDYSLTEGSRGLVPTRAKVVRGITLKREELGVDEWLAEMADLLEQEAAKSGRSREALAKALGLR